MSRENVIFIAVVTTAIGVIAGFLGGWNSSMDWHNREAVRVGAALYTSNKSGRSVFTWKTFELQPVEVGMTNQVPEQQGEI